MAHYPSQDRILVAVDCIIFGFDGKNLQLLLVKRNFEPEKNKWSLMGGFLHQEETLDEAATRVLNELTGLEGVFLEQMKVFSDPGRDPIERVLSVAYFALLDLNRLDMPESNRFQSQWFLLNEKPELIFDHDEMVRQALLQLRYKASIHPLLFELLPMRFTVPQLQALYEAVFDTEFDNRNFTRKLLSTGLLVKQNVKDKSGSKKGAYLYKLDKRKYKQKQSAFLNLVAKPDKFLQ